MSMFGLHHCGLNLLLGGFFVGISQASVSVPLALLQ